MGIWIELGIFLLVFVFAYFQLKELKQEKLKREKEREREQAQVNPSKLSTNKKPHQVFQNLVRFFYI